MTIAEIAKMAGVSKACVSRYLNHGYVSEEKKRKIQQVIDTTGYVPSRQAQILRTGKSRLIGVILEDEQAYHTVHIAFGTNVGFGGANQADCHMDGVIRNPTLYLDDTLVLKDGEFQI